MERKMGFSSFLAFAKASSPHGYQSTGLWACWSRYGLFSRINRLANGSACGISSFTAKRTSSPAAIERKNFGMRGRLKQWLDG